MTKRDSTKIFIDETYSSPPKKNYPTKIIICNHIDETWSIDLADKIDYKISNNKGYRYIFVIIYNFSKITLSIPLKKSQTITQEFSKILTTSKRSPIKIESDRGTEFHNSIIQTYLKCKNLHQYSRFTEKDPSIAERVIRTVRNLLKKPVLEKRKADWLSELSSIINQYNNTIHNSTKTTPIQTSKKVNEKIVYSNLQH